jgi:hypothetical protein
MQACLMTVKCSGTAVAPLLFWDRWCTLFFMSFFDIGFGVSGLGLGYRNRLDKQSSPQKGE